MVPSMHASGAAKHLPSADKYISEANLKSVTLKQTLLLFYFAVAYCSKIMIGLLLDNLFYNKTNPQCSLQHKPQLITIRQPLTSIDRSAYSSTIFSTDLC